MAGTAGAKVWRLVVLGLLIVVIAGGAVYGPTFYRIARLASGFYAKTLCSGVFVSNRDPKTVVEVDVLADMTPLLKAVRGSVERESGLVTASVFGLASQAAVYRTGLGCTLAIGKTVAALKADAMVPEFDAAKGNGRALWPAGTSVAPGDFPEIDYRLLEEAIDIAFSEPDPMRLRRTRAIVVVHKGRIVGERYAEGIGARTALLGWSMTKSVFNALTGILVGDGKLTVEKQGLLKEWRGPGDRRNKISLDDLLRMSGGLEFDEDYGAMLSDVRRMLFLTGDMAAFAANRPLIAEPGAVRHYSSGTSNIIARILREAHGGTPREFLTFPFRALFNRIGVRTAVIETDANGNFVASSYMFASARDWARIGLLYLNDGLWNGARIWPEGWLAYSLRPTIRKDSDYGAHIWLDLPKSLASTGRHTPPVPKDAYYMLGHDGQMVAIIPSRQLVVVRLGLSRRKGAWDHGAFLSDVLRAVR